MSQSLNRITSGTILQNGQTISIQEPIDFEYEVAKDFGARVRQVLVEKYGPLDSYDVEIEGVYRANPT